MFIKVVERWQGVQADMTCMALLWLICMDGLQMDLQHRKAMEVSLRAVRAGICHFSPVPSSTYRKRQTAKLETHRGNLRFQTKCWLSLLYHTSSLMTQAYPNLLHTVGASSAASFDDLAWL